MQETESSASLVTLRSSMQVRHIGAKNADSASSLEHFSIQLLNEWVGHGWTQLNLIYYIYIIYIYKLYIYI